jgi:LysR family hydrogen peroxide-inducible transcriptional activator
MNITLRQLQYLQALGAQRHFGRAAETCNVSQPALSVQIKQLEDRLGAPLVERRARDVLMTPFGQRVLDQAARVLDEVRVLEDLARWRGGLAGRLALGIIPTVAPYLLPGALAALRARDIALDVQVHEAQTARLLSDLAEGRIDAAILALPSGAEGLNEVPLFDDRFLLAGSAQRLDQLPATLAPTALGPSQLLLLEDGHCLSDQALEVCALSRDAARINMRASSLATLSRLVAAGFGLTFMPEIAARAELRAAPGLALRRFPGEEPARRLGLVTRQTAAGSAWVTDLADLLTGAGTDLTEDARAAW